MISLLTPIAWATTAEYARPELLPETNWLAQHLNDFTIRIVDMHSEEAYRKGHIPGAVNLGWQAQKMPTTNCTLFLPRNSPV